MSSHDYSHCRTGACMSEHDFGETYTYLELFLRTYDLHEEEVKTALNAILEMYMQEYNRSDPIRALKELKNPRNAGRKQQIADDDIRRIKELRSLGQSIRSISEETRIPKSTVQRVLNRPLSRN